MVSSPRDLPVLDVEHEKRLMEEAIKNLRTGGLVEMTWLEGQTWSDLQEAMWGGPWHVFHFIGHGGFDEASGEGAIALADDAGRKHLLGARNLARLRDDHYTLRLAFLNYCEGARGSVRDAFSSTATTLVRRGIPAVVAMQYEITDKAAIAFARVFYRAAANGLPVDAAVAAGRTAVSMESALEWGTPVLYMRAPDGHIFDISTGTHRPELTTEAISREELLRQYREHVESIWTDRQLTRSEVEWLDGHTKELGLSLTEASAIERTVMGDTKEAILALQEHAVGEEADQEQQAVTTEPPAFKARVQTREPQDQDVPLAEHRMLLFLGVTGGAWGSLKVYGDRIEFITDESIADERQDIIYLRDITTMKRGLATISIKTRSGRTFRFDNSTFGKGEAIALIRTVERLREQATN